jgi:uncharacterized protein (TIGR02145 family)
MAKNLNFKPTTAPDSSWCYKNDPANCAIYGRLYDWATALNACPTGWHLPDTTEWNTLEAAVGGAATGGTALMANSTLWSSGGAGTDAYGFSALPGGYKYYISFTSIGNYGAWWTATPSGSFNAYMQGMDKANMGGDWVIQSNGFSVRCLLD